MEENELFDFMVNMYVEHKDGTLSEEAFNEMQKLDEQSGSSWIEHVESELIKMGLQFHSMTKEMNNIE